MKIAIVGAGQVGTNLARLCIDAGHEVSMANSSGAESLTALADELGALPSSVDQVATDADVVIIAVPTSAVPQLPLDVIAFAAPGAVVIDTTNYYPHRDGHIAAIEAGTPESTWVSLQLRRGVVKVFNNIWAGHLVAKASKSGDPYRVALPVAGDEQVDKERVLSLVDQIGFDAVDAGGLSESWRQQPGSPVYGADGDIDGVRKLLAEATAERPSKWRAR